jgi:hypothetical protein
VIPTDAWPSCSPTTLGCTPGRLGQEEPDLFFVPDLHFSCRKLKKGFPARQEGTRPYESRITRIVLALIMAISQSAFAADEFIWTDRRNQMGREFQTGYSVGIADGLHVLGPWFTIGPDIFTAMLSKMYGCANQFATVRDASKFAAQAMQSQGPKSMAAVVILRSLDTHSHL